MPVDLDMIVGCDAATLPARAASIKNLLTMLSYQDKQPLNLNLSAPSQPMRGRSDMTMSAQEITKTHEHLPSRTSEDFSGYTLDKIAPHLVGHTVDEVERELILYTLVHLHGSRTRSASILGISIRCIRKNIREYEDRGIAVRAPGEPHIRTGHQIRAH
jgi:DNA-binding NtrC family response regulator